MLARLLERADVFVQNLAPGAADRLGTAPADAARAPPAADRLHRVGLRDRRGPYAQKKAYDLLVQSEVGLVSITGSDDAPAKAGISVADIAAGMYAVLGNPDGAVRAAATGRRRVARRLALRCARRVDEPRRPTTPAYGGRRPPRTGAEPRVDRALRSVSRRRRRRDVSRRSRTPASGRASAPTCSAGRRWPTDERFTPTRGASRIGRRCTPRSSRVFATADGRRYRRAARVGADRVARG